MTARKTPAQAAASWYLFLREDPDDENLKCQFEEWLVSNPAHAQAWADMNITASVMAAVPSSSSVPCKPSWRKHMRFSAPRQLMAGCGMALAAAFAVLTFITPDMLMRFRADHYAPIGQTRNIHLADGSEIILAPRAAISITMNASERRVHLIQGEALFKVHHELARPFHVTTGDITVTDIGTTFDIRVDNNNTTVGVREGAVHVTSRHSKLIDRDLYAGDWEQITDGTAITGKTPVASIGAWSAGILIARNETIADLIDALRPWTATRIILADYKLSNKRVTGTYDLNQPEASLRLIVDAYGGKVSSLMSWVDIISSR